MSPSETKGLILVISANDLEAPAIIFILSKQQIFNQTPTIQVP